MLQSKSSNSCWRFDLERVTKKAVFPVAGFGTRFLPATKAMPKELLPIVDKPLIQYVAEEAIAAGIDSPYEAPETPEIHINTTTMSIDDAAEQIVKQLLGE